MPADLAGLIRLRLGLHREEFANVLLDRERGDRWTENSFVSYVLNCRRTSPQRRHFEYQTSDLSLTIIACFYGSSTFSDLKQSAAEAYRLKPYHLSD